MVGVMLQWVSGKGVPTGCNLYKGKTGGVAGRFLQGFSIRPVAVTTCVNVSCLLESP